jgi:hypothetical protein
MNKIEKVKFDLYEHTSQGVAQRPVSDDTQGNSHIEVKHAGTLGNRRYGAAGGMREYAKPEWQSGRAIVRSVAADVQRGASGLRQ